jgi:hypothetical protein
MATKNTIATVIVIEFEPVSLSVTATEGTDSNISNNSRFLRRRIAFAPLICSGVAFG